MHYYKRNLGDYAKKAGRLSMLQHGSYTLLIDACYDREQFPTLSDAIEWTWASSASEIEAVEFVLRKFFVLEDGIYVQKRIQEEIAEYHEKAKTNKRIALEREANRKGSGAVCAPVVDEPSPNHKPITINHKPNKPKTAVDKLRGFDEFWTTYPKKVGKGDAEKAWGKIAIDDLLLHKIITTVKAASKSADWLKESGQYIPHASTWLNGKRWEDSIPVGANDVGVQPTRHHVLVNGKWIDERFACGKDPRTIW